MDNTCVQFICVNYKGERAVRKVRPIRLYFGSTEYHPEPQWLLEAFDLEKQATRDFALSGIVWPWSTVEAAASPALHHEVRSGLVAMVVVNDPAAHRELLELCAAWHRQRPNSMYVDQEQSLTSYKKGSP